MYKYLPNLYTYDHTLIPNRCVPPYYVRIHEYGGKYVEHHFQKLSLKIQTIFSKPNDLTQFTFHFRSQFQAFQIFHTIYILYTFFFKPLYGEFKQVQERTHKISFPYMIHYVCKVAGTMSFYKCNSTTIVIYAITSAVEPMNMLSKGSNESVLSN